MEPPRVDNTQSRRQARSARLEDKGGVEGDEDGKIHGFPKKKKKKGLFMFWCPVETAQDASLEKTTSFPAALPSWSGSLYQKDTLGGKGPSPGPYF